MVFNGECCFPLKFRMLFSVFVLSVLGAALALEVPNLEPLSAEMIDYINNHADTTWKV